MNPMSSHKREDRSHKRKDKPDHKSSKFKESNSNKHHPNLGKAPAKKQRNAKTNASEPAKNAQAQAPQARNAKGPKCSRCVALV
jgi:hypothetical protein